MSLLAASLLWFGNLFQSLELMLRRISLRTVLYGFLVPSKVNRTQIGAISLVHMFRSDRLDTLVLFHSVLCT